MFMREHGSTRLSKKMAADLVGTGEIKSTMILPARNNSVKISAEYAFMYGFLIQIVGD